MDAILASTAVPGLLPPVEVNGEHFLDGGLVNSIPVDRAVEMGATDLYVLHVGRIERPLQPPANLLQVALVSFEIARRHRFEREMRALPTGVIAHVLPTGTDPPAYARSHVRHRDALSPVAFAVAFLGDLLMPRRWRITRLVAVAVTTLAFEGGRDPRALRAVDSERVRPHHPIAFDEDRSRPSSC